jgi:uncharacterized protein
MTPRSTDRALGDPPPDCQSCGACCFSTLPEYIRVFGVDRDRMGDTADKVTEFIENRCYMRMEGGRCTALEIDPKARRFRCSIYEVRPDTCRSLVAGTGACLGEIHEKRDRPVLAIEELLRADTSRG